MKPDNFHKWQQRHGQTPVDLLGDSTERSSLLHYQGTVDGTPINTENAERIETSIRHQQGQLEAMSAFYRREGRCALVQYTPATPGGYIGYMINTIQAVSGRRPMSRPHQLNDSSIHNLRALTLATLSGLGVGSLSMLIGLVVPVLFGPGVGVSGMSVFLLAITALTFLCVCSDRYRAESSKTVRTFPASEAEPTLRRHAPQIAQTLYGKPSGYFESDETAEIDRSMPTETIRK